MVQYRKISDVSPGLILFQRHFFGGSLLLNHKIHFLRNCNYRSLQNYFHHLQFRFRYQAQIQLFH